MSSFQCKQFTIRQHKCAMKVSTDSLILGSWAEPGHHQTMLDIGTGTGILSLMLMQRAAPTATIDAVDIDAGAVSQANDNATASPWASRIAVRHTDISRWQPVRRYSLMITNPPYFAAPEAKTSAYTRQTPARKMARQTDTLSPEMLFKFASAYLLPDGELYCLYPAETAPLVVSAARAQGLALQRRLDIRHNPDKHAYVSALCFSRKAGNAPVSVLTIRDQGGHYTPQYKSLCQPYYLNF